MSTEQEHQDFRLQNDREWKAKVDFQKARAETAEVQVERLARERDLALDTVQMNHAACVAAEAKAEALSAECERLTRELTRDHDDLCNVLKSALYHFGPEGAAKLTSDALKGRVALSPIEPEKTGGGE